MEDNRIVVARFMLGEKNCVTAPIYQYNYGNVLRFEGLALPSTFEVHFSNDQFGESTTAIGTDNEVTIPDTYLTDPGDIYVWIYLHDTAEDGETVYQIMIPLIARAEITNEQPTPEQQDAISQAIAALNEAVSDCESAVEHYPEIGENGNWYVWDGEAGDWVDTEIHAQGEKGDTGATGAPGTDGRDGVDGKDGKDGKDGSDGVDGHSPVVTADKSDKVTTIYVDGTAIAEIDDGVDGQDGQNGRDGTDGTDGRDGAPGADGYSPSATVSKSGDTATITITDKNGTTTATVSDGDPTALIDDTSTASNKVWSANKLNSLLIADISNEVFGGGS